MAKKELDWAKTGTVAGMAEWLRSKSGAFVVVVVRRDNSVLVVDPEIAPLDARGLVGDHLPGLIQDLAIARHEKRRAARLELGPLPE
jgi:cysteine synthase